MSSTLDIFLADMRTLLRSLGQNGGQISASVYDTAQGLRFAPPEDVKPALKWLATQQYIDGGWGNMAAPLARHVPTLASVLALHKYAPQFPEFKPNIQEGIDFLVQNAYQWQPPLPEELPVGVELILPNLLCEAAGNGLEMAQEPYQALSELGQYKRKLITRMKPGAGTPPVFSWEAWGEEADTHVQDETGGIGHSPSATAYWLYRTQDQPDMAVYREKAQHYLQQATQATGLDIPGVLPSAWPIDRFEQSLALHALQMGGLLHSPLLETVAKPQIADLAAALRPDGIGFSDVFATDGDDTLAAVAVLKASGYDVAPSTFAPFEYNQHFLGYPGEMQPSPSVTARGIHVLHLYGRDTSHPIPFLMQRRNSHGAWSGDKWNSSWLYITYLTAHALQLNGALYQETFNEAVQAVSLQQNPDGGWGLFGASNFTETAYALSLLQLLKCDQHSDVMRRGYNWMLQNYRPFVMNSEQWWLNKQEYRPYRIDRAFELSALINLAMLCDSEA
ncbi:MAG: hypothetical protein R3E31_15385 [Chloroflexota bacterium]